MHTEITLKIKALAIAIVINGLMLGAAAYLFDGQLHGKERFHAELNGAAQHSGLVSVAFRP